MSLPTAGFCPCKYLVWSTTLIGRRNGLAPNRDHATTFHPSFLPKLPRSNPRFLTMPPVPTFESHLKLKVLKLSSETFSTRDGVLSFSLTLQIPWSLPTLSRPRKDSTFGPCIQAQILMGSQNSSALVDVGCSACGFTRLTYGYNAYGGAIQPFDGGGSWP